LLASLPALGLGLPEARASGVRESGPDDPPAIFPGGKFAPADRSPLLNTPHEILGGRPFPDTVSRKPVPTAESKPTGRNCSLWWGKPTGRILLSFRLSRIHTGRIPATSGNLPLSLPKGQPQFHAPLSLLSP
jgi:hypothetical protein